MQSCNLLLMGNQSFNLKNMKWRWRKARRSPPVPLSLDDLIQIFSFLDRHQLANLSFTSHLFFQIVDRHFREKPRLIFSRLIIEEGRYSRHKLFVKPVIRSLVKKFKRSDPDRLDYEQKTERSNVDFENFPGFVLFERCFVDIPLEKKPFVEFCPKRRDESLDTPLRTIKKKKGTENILSNIKSALAQTTELDLGITKKFVTRSNLIRYLNQHVLPLKRGQRSIQKLRLFGPHLLRIVRQGIDNPADDIPLLSLFPDIMDISIELYAPNISYYDFGYAADPSFMKLIYQTQGIDVNTVNKSDPEWLMKRNELDWQYYNGIGVMLTTEEIVEWLHKKPNYIKQKEMYCESNDEDPSKVQNLARNRKISFTDNCLRYNDCHIPLIRLINESKQHFLLAGDNNNHDHWQPEYAVRIKLSEFTTARNMPADYNLENRCTGQIFSTHQEKNKDRNYMNLHIQRMTKHFN